MTEPLAFLLSPTGSLLLVPFVAVPLFAYFIGLWRFQSTQDTVPSSFPERLLLISILVFLLFLSVLAAFSWDDVSPFSRDDERDLAAVLSIVRGDFVPLRGPDVSGAPVFMGPLYYLYEALFALVIKGPLFAVFASMTVLAAAMCAGSRFLRMLSGRKAVWCFLVLSGLVVRDRMAVLTHCYLGFFVGIMTVWVLWDAVRRNTDKHVPLLFLGLGLSMQLYAVNLVWVAAVLVVLYSSGINVSARAWAQGIGWFVLTQIFTIGFLVAGAMFDPASGGVLPDISPAHSIQMSPLSVLKASAPALVALPLMVVSALAGLVFVSNGTLCRRPFLRDNFVPLAFLSVVLIVVGVLVAFGAWKVRYSAFLIPVGLLCFAVLFVFAVDSLEARFGRVARAIAPISIILGCMALIVLSSGSIYMAFSPDSSGSRFSDRFSANRFGNTLLEFFERGGVTTRAGYVTHAHSLQSTWGAMAPPLFPLFYFSDRQLNAVPQQDFVFMPQAGNRTAGSIRDSGADTAFLKLKGFSVIRWNSRLRVAGIPVVAGASGKVSQSEACGRRLEYFDTFRWPAQIVAGIGTHGRAFVHDDESLNEGGPAKCETSASGTVSLKIPVEAGSPRTLAVMAADGDCVAVSFDGWGPLQKAMGDPVILDPGRSVLAYTAELGPESGVLTVSVMSRGNCPTILDVMDIPLTEPELRAWLTQNGTSGSWL